jgi:hypothetical protein
MTAQEIFSASHPQTAQAIPAAPSDAQIRESVSNALGDLGREFSFRIVVQAHQGEVLLRGAVSSPFDRIVILRQAASQAGVIRVHDRLTVQSRPPRPADLIQARFRRNAILIAEASLIATLAVIVLAWLLAPAAPLTSQSARLPAAEVCQQHQAFAMKFETMKSGLRHA